jgi:hypothetical protein
MKKEFRGLGVPDVREPNMCLLASWVGMYSRDEEEIWKDLVDFKYRTKNLNIF